MSLFKETGLFSTVVSRQKRRTFSCRKTFKSYQNFKYVNLGKRQYLSHHYIDNGFKGIVVNQTCHSNGRSREIMLTVPLRTVFF